MAPLQNHPVSSDVPRAKRKTKKVTFKLTPQKNPSPNLDTGELSASESRVVKAKRGRKKGGNANQSRKNKDVQPPHPNSNSPRPNAIESGATEPSPNTKRKVYKQRLRPRNK